MKSGVIVIKRKALLMVVIGMLCAIFALFLYFAANSGLVPVIAGVCDDLTIAIDAGHGGFDGGAKRENVVEAPLNLAVSFYLKDELEALGAKVVMTRAGDGALGKDKNSDMKRRAKVFSDPSIDYAISIHQNAHTKPNASGPAVFYSSKTQPSVALADCVQRALCEELEMETVREIKAGDFLLLNCAKSPAILVECGFISNPTDRDNLQNKSYQKRIAKAIAQGLKEFLALPQPTPSPVAPARRSN